MDDRGKEAKKWPERKKVLLPMLERIRADILLLQEVNSLTALEDLRHGTDYEDFYLVHTQSSSGKPFPVRNLAVLSRWKIAKVEQYRNQLTSAPEWRTITASPPEKTAKPVLWERPILHAEIPVANKKTLHILNLHLKSMNPTDIQGQKSPDPKKWYVWQTNKGWAEGYYLSDIKRVGQALEARVLVDELFKQEGDDALIVVGGDFNAEVGSVPFKAIVGSVDDTQNPDLLTSVLIPCELNVPPDERYSLIHHGKGNMIDHIAVSQAFYPYWAHTSIFNEMLADESIAFATDVIFPQSDHAPVVASFAVPDSWIS